MLSVWQWQWGHLLGKVAVSDDYLPINLNKNSVELVLVRIAQAQ